MNSESEFIDEINKLLVVTKDEPIEYRLHYNELGEIYLCTMVQHPEATQYVVVNKETYDNYHKYRVVNGLIEKIVHQNGIFLQLAKSNKGYRVVKNNAALLIQDDESYPDIEYYDRKFN